MKSFIEPLEELKEFNELRDDINLKRLPVQVTGCIDSQKLNLIYGIGEKYRFKVIVTSDEIKAKELYEDYRLYNRDVFVYLSKDVIFYNADLRGNAIVKSRIEILKRMIEKEATTIIMSIDGGMDRLMPLEYLENSIIHITQDSQIDLHELARKLIYIGYERNYQVEQPGDFALRGGIIDIFPLTEEAPYRIELWGDEIDSIRSFDVESQRSIENVEFIKIYPATEIVLDKERLNKGIEKIDAELEIYWTKLRESFKTEEAARIKNSVNEFKENVQELQGFIGLESYIKYFYDESISFFDYFSNEDTVFFLDEPSRLVDKGKAVEIEFRESMASRIEKGYVLPGQIDIIHSHQEVLTRLAKKNTVLMTTMDAEFPYIKAKRKHNFSVQGINSYHKNFEILTNDLAKWKDNDYRVILLCSSRTRAKRLSDDFQEYELNAFYSDDKNRILKPGEIMVTHGHLRRGFEYPKIKLVIISESDVFGVKKKKRRQKRKFEGKKIQSFDALSVGDYVVHENHGLGIYKGIEQIEVEKTITDYIKIEYGDGGVLYIPATGLDLIQKYASAGARKPRLNKLNSQEWKKTKARVKLAVKEMAIDLVELYAKRQARKGFVFGEDTVWQKEFEEAFPFEETNDQLLAIEATKRDMESEKIMDRLICGDVGYGKTEVAIRAAFKAISDGKQVAMLVPTTILAQQHYNTFCKRMEDYPISVEMLSRFRTSKQQKEIIGKLSKGSMDIIIGTHRILSKDIKFKNLGLLIVDEEQRFGVTHKEKVKEMKGDVDVLTLTATPIPRTLHMSLVGIRDMSVLDEAPVDRMPIQTYVMEHNEEIIRESINRELARGGQVYYVFNRVQGIDKIANLVAELVPTANVTYAHGQMGERDLERIMYDFTVGDIDVLISTTIIETGLDISNVNTIIVDDADRLGLSQLYQLRGRVGRSNKTAYAFLLYKKDKMLREEAEKRLHAIKEFTELGSGFKIAMRDLEIRGAGNLLGADQSGHMETVGYEMYSRMLNDAVSALKDGELGDGEAFETTIDLGLDAFIPSTYIRREFEKLDIYKRIAEIENEEELLDMQEELLDRFGDMPKAVNNLLKVALIKSMGQKVYITSIKQKGFMIEFTMYQQAKINVEMIPDVIEKHGGKLTLYPDTIPYFEYELKEERDKDKINYSLAIENIIRLLIDFQGILLKEDKKKVDLMDNEVKNQ